LDEGDGHKAIDGLVFNWNFRTMTTVKSFPALLAALAIGAALPAIPAAATPVGPHAALCEAGNRSVTVRVSGFRVRTGRVRVQLYAADPRTFLERGRWLQRIEVPASGSGDLDICVPVASAGRYAIMVRHDANANGSNDRSDGAGFSGNPRVSLLDLALRRKPPLDRVAFAVAEANVTTRVVLNYVQGTRFGPIS
jgi:uncharacterized protein (DUF2141 family)